jgi:hypothetical protein
MRHAPVSRTGGNDGQSGTLIEALFDFQKLDQFREHPLRVRMIFQAIVVWLPNRERTFPLAAVNASFAKQLRDKAAQERGWRFGNHALVLLQAVIARAVDIGTLTVNCVRQIPKLPPPFRVPSNDRRAIRPVRYGISASTHSSEPKKSTR